MESSQTLAPSSEQEQIQESIALFNNCLAEQTDKVPEILARHVEIGEVGEELISKYAIKPGLFDDKARGLVFTAIANHAVISSDSPDFEHSAISLLAHNYSEVLRDEHKVIEDAGEKSGQKSVYERYTNKQLTQELETKMRAPDGLLKKVKIRMQITEENESPYKVRVLDIDPQGLTCFGISFPFAPDEAYEGKTLEEKDKMVWDEWEANNVFHDHLELLEKRADEMFDELGAKARNRSAWVDYDIDNDGVPTVCITSPVAEKLLYPEVTADHKKYSEYAHVDLGTLGHEYVHTQGGLNLDRDAQIGINLEERRAEYFSNDTGGYPDTKFLMKDIWTVTGFDIKHVFDKYVMGGQPEEVYRTIALEMGLDSMLKIVLASPSHYREFGNEYQRTAFEGIGQYDGILQGLLEAQTELGNTEDIEKRIDFRVKEPSPSKLSRGQRTNLLRAVGQSRVVLDLIDDRAAWLEKQHPRVA